MYKAIINQEKTVKIEPKNLNKTIDLVDLGNNCYHIIKNNKSYKAEIIQIDTSSKLVKVRINNNDYQIELKDKMDILLETMGISTATVAKVDAIKAPMPGLVVDIMVKEGDTIQKGDKVLVLDAMKMENVIQAPGDGVIKSIDITKGSAVDKGQILISLS